MLLAALLSTLVGVALGLFGGGGSILTVPILVYAAGLDAQTAIATSLLVVGITSVAALVPHARAGNVEFRTGLIFGSAGMVGAFLGGRLAQYIPSGVLLAGFGVMMLATAVAMFRQRPLTDEVAVRTSTPWSLLLLEGAGVGLVTGMVGAGGGFLVVPALVMLGGLPLSKAVGTSLLVIAMKSSAGFVGYLGHVSVPWEVAGRVVLAATVGAFAGQLLGARLKEAKLRRGFAAFVVVMAMFTLSRQLPAVVRESFVFQAVFVERWPFWIGGAGVALICTWPSSSSSSSPLRSARSSSLRFARAAAYTLARGARARRKTLDTGRGVGRTALRGGVGHCRRLPGHRASADRRRTTRWRIGSGWGLWGQRASVGGEAAPPSAQRVEAANA